MDSMQPEAGQAGALAAWWVEDRRKDPPELAWLVGRTVTRIEKVDYTWFFKFDDDSSIATEGSWRLISVSRIAVTSEDHGHPFGLPAPVDAAQITMLEVGGKVIERFEVDERTGDLSLFFGETGAVVQFLQLSCGYENWRTHHGSQDVFCTGGGSLVMFGSNPP
jgi:hypothetical protein